MHANWIASKLLKTDNTGLAYSAESPSHGSVTELLQKVAEDPARFPGKHGGTPRGAAPMLTSRKRRRIAASAMTQKATGLEGQRRGDHPQMPSGHVEPHDEATVQRQYHPEGVPAGLR